MAMRLVFMRHGHKDPSTQRLTEEGRVASRRAGDWLCDQGLVPAVVVVTMTERTLETAHEVLGRFGGAAVPEPQRRKGIPADVVGFATFADGLVAEAGSAGVALVVGHHPTQNLVERSLGGARLGVPKSARASVFVLERRGDAWSCVGGLAGLAARETEA